MITRRAFSRLSGEVLNSVAKRFGDRPALTIGNKTLTYKELIDKAIGFHPCDSKTKFAMLLPFHSADFIIGLSCAWLNDCCFLSLNPSHPPELLKYFIEDYKPDAILIDSTNKFLRQENVVSQIEDRTHNAESNDFLVLYTSGTTGRPKGVVHSQMSIAAQINSMVETWHWTPDDCILQVLPLHHIHGLVNCVLTPLSVGAHCVLCTGNHFNAKEIFNRLVYEDPIVTVFMAVPTVYYKLLSYYTQQNFSDQQKADIRRRFSTRLRLMVSGSASLPDTIYKSIFEMTGLGIVEQYGSTEMGRCLSTRPEQPLDQRIAGFVGQPMPHVRVKLIKDVQDIENFGTSVYVGELLMKGPGLFTKYLNKPKSTIEAFDDGYFKTGDIACLNTDLKSYKILGRNSVDIIKSGGYKISALEVESALLNHPSVEECAVFGILDDIWGERVTALIVTSKDTVAPDLENIRNFCAKYIPKYACPTCIKIVQEPLERNAIGKIDKKHLKNIFLSNH